MQREDRCFEGMCFRQVFFLSGFFLSAFGVSRTFCLKVSQCFLSHFQHQITFELLSFHSFHSINNLDAFIHIKQQIIMLFLASVSPLLLILNYNNFMGNKVYFFSHQKSLNVKDPHGSFCYLDSTTTMPTTTTTMTTRTTRRTTTAAVLTLLELGP